MFPDNIKPKCFTLRSTPLTTIYLKRSNHRMCSGRKGVLRNFTKFTGKYQEFCKISKNTFFTEHLWATRFCLKQFKLLKILKI